MTFGERLREARQARFLTQEQLGDHLGVSKQSIQNFEHGMKAPFSLQFIHAVADLLEVEPSWLMGRPVLSLEEAQALYEKQQRERGGDDPA